MDGSYFNAAMANLRQGAESIANALQESVKLYVAKEVLLRAIGDKDDDVRAQARRFLGETFDRGPKSTKES